MTSGYSVRKEAFAACGIFDSKKISPDSDSRLGTQDKQYAASIGHESSSIFRLVVPDLFGVNAQETLLVSGSIDTRLASFEDISLVNLHVNQAGCTLER